MLANTTFSPSHLWEVAMAVDSACMILKQQVTHVFYPSDLLFLRCIIFALLKKVMGRSRHLLGKDKPCGQRRRTT